VTTVAGGGWSSPTFARETWPMRQSTTGGTFGSIWRTVDDVLQETSKDNVNPNLCLYVDDTIDATNLCIVVLRR
jgi:hypothetical protein